MPYLVRRVVEVRRILEEFSVEIPESAPLLTEAYGIMLFKCPILSCTRFYQGFATRQQRDKHLGQHERAHKCTHDGCDYRELGFPTEAELRRHVELCHDVLPEDTTFPNVQRVNLNKALNDAIDRDDAQAVREICSEISVSPLRQTGFILRAMKRRLISTTLILIELIGTDVEMNHNDGKGRTALHEAVQIRNDDLFDRILGTEIDVDVQDRDGLTPFMTALDHGYLHAIQLLMDHATVEDERIRDSYYKGIKKAAAAGSDDIVKAIFSKFVSISKSTYKSAFEKAISRDLGQIIAKAASNSHESTVKLILELAHALDLERMYQGLLRKELHHGIEAMTTFLIQRYGEAKPEVDKKGKTYGNALAKAAMKDDSALVMSLLNNGADIDYADGLAYNALGAASSRGKLSMVSLLVEQGADINAKGGSYGNALYLACRGKHTATVDFLLEKGANVTLSDVSGGTALFAAARYGSKEVVNILLRNRADVNLQGKSGDTALSIASRYGSKEFVDILLRNGADVHLQDEYGETALFAALQRGYKEVVNILLRNRADVNLQGKSGDTALFAASQYGHKEAVDILLQNGADINLQNKSGKTALFVAFEGGKKEVIQVLIKAELDIKVKDSYQRTPLLKAAEEGWEDIVQILIDKGADIDSVDKYQQTALLIASRKGHAEVVRILLASGAKGLEAALFIIAFMDSRRDISQLLLDQVHEDETDMYTPGGVYDNALSWACSLAKVEFVLFLLKEARLKIPVKIYDRALGSIGSGRYLPPDKYETIAKLLRERRAAICRVESWASSAVSPGSS